MRCACWLAGPPAPARFTYPSPHTPPLFFLFIPSLFFYSEILCNTGKDSTADAARIVELMHELDPRFGRLVTANSRAADPLPIGLRSPLDVAGYDYSTECYDAYHADRPALPSLSTESSVR